MELTNRELAVLCGIVEGYVGTGEPVASREVARVCGLGLSAATIRNVMAKLEERGFLDRLHSSAGCVPTDRGFRSYVDSMGPGRRLPGATKNQLLEKITAMRRELVEDIEWLARVVADATHEAGITVRPIEDGPVVDAVSLVPLGGQRVLGVVVSADGTVEKKVVIKLQEPTLEELQEEGNFLSSTFSGMSVDGIRRQVSEWERLGSDPDEMDPLLERALAVAQQLFEEDGGDVEVWVAGTDNLLEGSDFAEAGRIRSLLATLQNRRGIAREWRRALEKGRTQVIIGRESEVTASGNLGMVVTLFYRGGRRAGALGVVGPRRMDYGRIVPVMEYVGDTLTRMLEEPGVRHA